MSTTPKAIATPDVTITGGLMQLFGPAQTTPVAQPEYGSIEVALCGYGSYTPEVSGAKISLITQSVAMQQATDPNPGRFEIILYSNALIVPAGTYYTFTIRDANGDIAQCEAYILSPGQYDITQLTPYDPSQPPAPLPPLIFNELEIVPPANNMVFDGTSYTTFKTTLAGDVTQAVFQSMVPGNLYTFIIVQDGAGGHQFLWAANVNNFAQVNLLANATTIQTFVADDNKDLWAIAPGTCFV